MEINSDIPNHVFERYKIELKDEKYPNIIRTRNITKKGIDTLIEKNNLIWFKSVFLNEIEFLEGVVQYGKQKVYIYFKQLENDTTYKIFILTSDLNSIELLLIGLNKFFTIDKI